MKNMKTLSLLALTALFAVACSTQSQNPNGAAIPPEELAARTAVANKVGAPVDETGVAEKYTVEFSDSSLDCPEPDMMYAQVITPGYQIFVTWQERTFDVRVAGEFAQVCERGGTEPRRIENRSR